VLLIKGVASLIGGLVAPRRRLAGSKGHG
jgi:hypothetical protein